MISELKVVRATGVFNPGTINVNKKAYTKGMEEVLKEIAWKEYIGNHELEIKNRPVHIQEKIDEVNDLFYQLINTFNDERIRKVVHDYDDCVCALVAEEKENEFINGFIAGYRFLKELNENAYSR